MGKKQKSKKKVLLKQALSLVVAIAVATGIPGTLYSLVPVNAAETNFEEEAETSGEGSTLNSTDIAADTSEQTEEVSANDDDGEETSDEPDKKDTDGATSGSGGDAAGEETPDEPDKKDTDGATSGSGGDAAGEGTREDDDSDATELFEEDEPEAGVYGEQSFLLEAEFDGVIATAEFKESAMLPAGTKLSVRRIDPNEKLYEDCRDGAQKWIESKYGKYIVLEKDTEETGDSDFEKNTEETEASDLETEMERVEFVLPIEEMTDEEKAVMPELIGAEISAFFLLDISFVYEGEEIEPQEDVVVTVKFADEEFADEEDIVLLHYADAVGVILEQAFRSNENGEVEGKFNTGAFSEYAVVALKSSEYASTNENETEKTDSKSGFLKDGELTAQIDDAVVTVKFTEAARIPVGTELVVRKIAPNETAYAQRLEKAKDWIDAKYGKSDPLKKDVDPIDGLEEDSVDQGKEAVDAVAEEMTEKEASVLPPLPDTKTPEISAFALFDISLVCDGEEIEPEEAVQVTLRFADEKFAEKTNSVIIHFVDAEKAETGTIEVADEQDLKSGEDGFIEASFSTGSFSEYAVMAVRAAYTVWFDGTDGMGVNNSLVRGATNVQTIANGSGNTATVTLPTTAGTSTKYKLNGWYDINSGKYYKPGETATVTQNTVFYAEWVQLNYSPNPQNNVVSNQPDISSFVRTDVFDYNEIFNPYHGAELSNSQINSYSHSETWRDSGNVSDGGDFLFTNWYHQQYGETYLAFAQNLQLNRNRYNGAGNITTGIVSSTDDQLMEDLFGKSDAPGKVYLGQGDMLYQYDNNASSSRYGYYYYDSDKNAADYHEGDQRFYVYSSTQTIIGEGGDFGTRVNGFMPFEHGTSNIYQKNGQVNFWFGMQSTIDFFLPDNPGVGGNKATGGKDMEFYFSGDDDVWVFVDGILLLDLGGIHRKINGSINFSDGWVYVEGRRVSRIPDSIRSGDHQLQFYYLERGSSWSNASIYFNIAPRYGLELNKSDADNPNQLLEGAVFNVYADADCTIPASLWTSKEAYDKGDESVSTFVTGEGGTVSCYGLYASRTYYLKEVSSPPGYPTVSDKIIALRLNTNGDATIVEGADVASLTQDGATKKIDLFVTNKLPDVIDIPVKKNWYNQDGSQMSGEGEIDVELYRAEIDIPTGNGNSGTSPGGNVGAVLPVNIRTQFFNVAQNSNGANTDTSPLFPGDLETNTIVTQGGSLNLTIDVTAASAGIYSVTVNGKMISPVSTSNSSRQECFIGGRWGNYPPRHAVYKIDPAEEAMDIRVTLIGYLEYGGSPWHADTSYSMNITTTTTEPSAPGTGGETPEDPHDILEIPSTMPEGAELIKTTTLSEANEWSDIFEGLPARSEDGIKLFVYYVKEIYPDGYSTSYIGNGSIGGAITIYNVRLREISVKKEWVNFDNSTLTEGLPETIDLKLTQFDDTEGTSRDIFVTLTAAEGWQKKWRSNSSELNEQEGHSYRYKVTEIAVGNEYTVTYSDNNQSGIMEGTIVITNRRKAYSISFIKKDVTDHDINLQGARFSLYTEPDCAEEHIVEAYDSDSETAEKKTVFVSGENGAFNIYGLVSGTYYMKELAPPSGYYSLDYPMEIVIADEAGGVVSVRGVRLVDGVLTEVEDGTLMIEIVQGSILSVHIYNNPLYELPSTGGRGTYPLTVFGTCAFFSALFARRRRLTPSNSEKEDKN